MRGEKGEGCFYVSVVREGTMNEMQSNQEVRVG